MKTPFQYLALICIALIIFSTGCRKKESSGSVYLISNQEPANPMNPYDKFGYLHNSILDYINEKRTLNKSLNFDSSCRSIRQYYQAKFLPELQKECFNSIPQIVNDAATNIFQHIDRSKWSDSTKSRLSDLLRRLENLSFDSCTYPKIKITIIGFENEILGSNLTNIEKQVILKASSLARFSGYRWISHGNSQMTFDPRQLPTLHMIKGVKPISGVASNEPIANVKIFKKIGKWFAVTACDIGGAIVDLSVASGAASSDYMSAILDLH